MAIRVEHGQISTALQLAAMAGQAEQAVRLQAMQHQAAMQAQQHALQREAMAQQNRSMEIQAGLQFGQMARQERMAQQQLQERAAVRQAEEAMRVQTQQEQQAQRAAFTQRFGIEPELFEAQMRMQQEERMMGQAESLMRAREETAEQRAMRARLQPLERQLTNAERRLQQTTAFWERLSRDVMSRPEDVETAAEQMRRAQRDLDTALQEYRVAQRGMPGRFVPEGEPVTRRDMDRQLEMEMAETQQLVEQTLESLEPYLGPTVMANPRLVQQTVAGWLIEVEQLRPDDPRYHQVFRAVMAALGVDLATLGT